MWITWDCCLFKNSYWSSAGTYDIHSSVAERCWLQIIRRGFLTIESRSVKWDTFFHRLFRWERFPCSERKVFPIADEAWKKIFVTSGVILGCYASSNHTQWLRFISCHPFANRLLLVDKVTRVRATSSLGIRPHV